MRKILIVCVAGLLSVSPSLFAQSGSVSVSEPFKLGTFDREGNEFLGLVLRDAYVVDLDRANRDYQRSPLQVKLPMAKDMKELTGRYNLDLKMRIYGIVNQLLSENRLTGSNRPSYVYALSDVRTLAPIIYPNKILAAAGNYLQHLGEMGTEAPKKGEMAYVFQKPPTTSVIGNGDFIMMPKGREKMDWECELAAVIGHPAKDIPLEDAKNHIFGYTIMVDVSDRGGRPETQFGVDWLLGKGHDTYAPMGPFILPAEFVDDPHDLGLKLTVNGEIMQDSKGKYLSTVMFTIYELVTHGASLLTLEPGDVVTAGSPAGVGAGRNPQVFLKSGDVVVASIEKIGSLTNTVK